MARGKFWEMTFDPDWDGPSEREPLTELDGSSGLVERKVVNKEGAQSCQVKWNLNGPSRSFTDCDFELKVENSRISNCSFVRCRFDKSIWVGVKFSNCSFEKCDFSNVLFRRCIFINDCKFRDNSASAELFRIEETAISAKAFVGSLMTNLQHVGAVKHLYQKTRFNSTRQKIAKAIYSATRNEADLDYYFEAYEQLIRTTLDQAVERERLDDKQRFRSKRSCVLHSLPARFERAIVLFTGWLSNWGRSILRSGWFFGFCVLIFGSLYAKCDTFPEGANLTHNIVVSLIEAINITLVAGYTAHFRADGPLLLRCIWLLNMTAGLFWYSSIIPVLTRRVLR